MKPNKLTMIYKRSAIIGILLIGTSLLGFYIWWRGGFSHEDAYGAFMLSVVAMMFGLHFALQSVGLNLFGKDGSSSTGDSGSSWFDSDGGGDGGD